MKHEDRNGAITIWLWYKISTFCHLVRDIALVSVFKGLIGEEARKAPIRLVEMNSNNCVWIDNLRTKDGRGGGNVQHAAPHVHTG